MLRPLVSRLPAPPLALAAALALAALVPSATAASAAPRVAQDAEQGAATPDTPDVSGAALTNAALEFAWSGLTDAQRRDVTDWFQLELSYLETLQLRLIRYVTKESGVDAGLWPEPEPLTWFDPAVHAPAQVIPRRLLDPESDAAREARERFLSVVPKRPLDAAWIYDWRVGEPRRTGDDLDPERIFANGLLGYPPGLDYAEALVLRSLDREAMRTRLDAFEHLYTDRSGRAFPGITLYAAWGSGAQMEMPDVDTLGIVHEVLDDWDSWRAPVSKQESLYDRIGALFVETKNHRALREALARTYLSATPVLADGYDDVLYRLHAAWEDVSSTPSDLAAKLPADASTKELEDWLEGWTKQYRRSKIKDGAMGRSQILRSDAWAVRQTLVRVMRDYGAFEAPKGPDLASLADPAATEPAIILTPEAEDALLERVADMKGKDRKKLLAAAREAAEASGALQVELVAAVLEGSGVKRAKLRSPEEFDAHDAKKHLGGPARKTIGKSNKNWRELKAQLPEPFAPWTRGADYQLATGRVVELEVDDKDKTAELRNLLAGIAPDQDLAEAVLLRTLDGDGPLREEAEFFEHLYADREANAYEGITLYDVWSAQLPLEVPDPDARAYAHRVWKDKSIPVPLAAADQNRWYPRMGDSLKTLRRWDLTLRSLAATWFQGRPTLDWGYANSIDVFHADIAATGGDPEVLARLLSEDGTDYVRHALQRAMDGGNEAWNPGNARRDALLLGRERIRQAVLRCLAERGLLEG